MAGFRRVIALVLILCGPGFIIWFMAKTIENHFIELPYVGWSYTYDQNGNKIDSSAYNVPEFELTSFDGKIINRDSIRGKFIILTTIQNTCPELDQCGLGVVLFNEIIYRKMIKHMDNYWNVRVLSILTDENGNYDSIPGALLKEEMAEYDQKLWWFATGNSDPFYSFPYYGDLFKNYPTDTKGQIGSKAFVNSLVLIDKEGYIRGVTGAKRDTDIRNFFDLIKLIKKEEFKAEREKDQEH